MMSDGLSQDGVEVASEGLTAKGGRNRSNKQGGEREETSLFAPK